MFPNCSDNQHRSQCIELRKITRVLKTTSSHFQLIVPSFDVYAGDFTAVVGDSGCGKSTLLDLLGLVSRPTSGQYSIVRLDSEIRDVSRYWRENNETELSSLRASLMGYVMQTGGLFPYLSVWDNLVLPARLKGLDYSAEAVLQLAVEFNLVPEDSRKALTHFYRKKPRDLSGGQRQRVAIMRSLLSEPSIILADEPTAAIDSLTARKIVLKLAELTQIQQIAVIMVTHDRRLVRSVANRAYSFKLTASNDSGNIKSKLTEIDVGSL